MNMTRTRTIRIATLDRTARRRAVIYFGNAREITTFDTFTLPGLAAATGTRICRETVTTTDMPALYLGRKGHTTTKVCWHMSYGIRLYPGQSLSAVLAYMRKAKIIA